MKLKQGRKITTSCDICELILREDLIYNSIRSESVLHHSIVHMGKGRHKCKKCYKSGFKDKWRYILHPIKEEPKCKS